MSIDSDPRQSAVAFLKTAAAAVAGAIALVTSVATFYDRLHERSGSLGVVVVVVVAVMLLALAVYVLCAKARRPSQLTGESNFEHVFSYRTRRIVLIALFTLFFSSVGVFLLLRFRP